MMKMVELARALSDLGLKKNDIVLLHSSLSSLGEVEGGADAVIDAFLRVLGKGGTLVVPVFGQLGVIPDRLKERPGVVVSAPPVGTLAAVGGRAKELLDGHWEAPTAHGEGTPFLKIAQAGGYVCLLGVDQDRNTMLHSAEALLKLPYLGDVTCKCADPRGRQVTRTWKYYPGPHRNFIGLDDLFVRSGAMRVRRIGNSQVRLLEASAMLDAALAAGRADPAFVLCDNPACADCVAQRAAIRRHRLGRESFILAVSSRLAGRYVPEMIEKLQECGIGHLELDYLQGKACAQMPGEQLGDAVRQLAAAGIAVTGLRLPAPPNDWKGLAATCTAAGIRRIIVPLTATGIPYALLGKAGLSVAFYNTRQTAVQAAAAYAGHARAGKKAVAGLVLAPADFALAGEHPFLTSWKEGRLARITTQLDLCDALWDGTPTPLGQGNAELRELVSILRCRNFNGYMTLGGGIPCPDGLRPAADLLLKWLGDVDGRPGDHEE